MARMSDAQHQEIRAKRTERDGQRQIAASTAGSAPQYAPYVPYPPYSLPPPPPSYPPSVVHLPPPPPMHIASVHTGNRQNPALRGPRGQAPAGYLPTVTGSYNGLVAPSYPG
jgi:hypothetical protein